MRRERAWAELLPAQRLRRRYDPGAGAKVVDGRESIAPPHRDEKEVEQHDRKGVAPDEYIPRKGPLILDPCESEDSPNRRRPLGGCDDGSARETAKESGRSLRAGPNDADPTERRPHARSP